MLTNESPAPSPTHRGTRGGSMETTGRSIVVFAEQETHPADLMQAVGLTTVADSRDFGHGPVEPAATTGADAIVFHGLNMAVVTAEADQLTAMQTSSQHAKAVLAVSPELVHHTENPATWMDHGTSARPPMLGDTDRHTWGLQAIRADTSPCTGTGVGVAVLDTGLDLHHPDFAGRSITSASFVPDQHPQDGHGAGTHLTGIVCGPQAPVHGPRYGTAYEADIFIGKVFSDQGSGSDASVLAGVDWAINQRCAVIFLAGSYDSPHPHPPYTAAGHRALNRGSLLISAAGRNADRVNGKFGSVGPPASSPYIMAVGALTQHLSTTCYSARSSAHAGGQVDVSGPGYQVHSAWPMPGRYRTISGSSAAGAHAAGAAALIAQATGCRGRQLWAEITQTSHRLLEPSADVGAGLVLAPQR